MLMKRANGSRVLVAGQKSGVVTAVDPDRQGAIVWQKKIGQGGRLGGIQWGVSADDRRVYAAVSDAEVTAPPPGGEGGRPSVFGVPLMLNPKAGGGLYALDVGPARSRHAASDAA
jgi:polyvinyl alcohol dehydrogenase (cytochrome)